MHEQQAACSLSQRVLYELQVLRDAGALLQPELDAELIGRLHDAEQRHGEGMVVATLRHMHTRAWEVVQRGNLLAELERCKQLALEIGAAPRCGGEVHSAERKLVEVRRVVVTPTRVAVQPSGVEVSNRVLRSQFADAMIRVTFRDEAFGNLWAPLGLMEARIRHIFQNGFRLQLTGEEYIFLAYGQSQLKDRSAWFVRKHLEVEWKCEACSQRVAAEGASCQCGFTSADQVRACFGFTFPIAVDARFFPTIAKVGARMAQLFSTTTVGLGGSQSWHIEDDVPDIVRDRRDGSLVTGNQSGDEGARLANFSDGCGSISLDAMRQLCEVLRGRCSPNVPCDRLLQPHASRLQPHLFEAATPCIQAAAQCVRGGRNPV